jgi:hypothetical protein
MSAHVIRNPVPTPEQMAKILGISSERVDAVRGIMGSPRTEAGAEREKRHSQTAPKAGAKSKALKAAGKRKGARGKSTSR